MTREIILDTETTGLNAKGGDKIIEIACLEVINLVPSGKTFHQFIDPKRAINAAAQAVHGISREDVQGKPIFADIADEFLDFIDGAPLVIHNAPFDIGFIAEEMRNAGRQWDENYPIVDSLVMARKAFPGAPASLDALCKRFQIDLAGRELHGALIDCQLLAGVYLELRGGKQASLMSGDMAGGSAEKQAHAPTDQNDKNDSSPYTAPKRPAPLASALSAEDEAAHKKFLQDMPQKAIWLKDKD